MYTHKIITAALLSVLISGCATYKENSISCKSPLYYGKLDFGDNTYHALDRITSVSPRIVTRGNMDITIETCTTFDAKIYHETNRLPIFEEKVSVISSDGDAKILKHVQTKTEADGGLHTKTIFTFPPEIPKGVYTIQTELLYNGNLIKKESSDISVR